MWWHSDDFCVIGLLLVFSFVFLLRLCVCSIPLLFVATITIRNNVMIVCVWFVEFVALSAFNHFRTEVIMINRWYEWHECVTRLFSSSCKINALLFFLGRKLNAKIRRKMYAFSVFFPFFFAHMLWSICPWLYSYRFLWVLTAVTRWTPHER